jgi:hypothetical protein
MYKFVFAILAIWTLIFMPIGQVFHSDDSMINDSEGKKSMIEIADSSKKADIRGTIPV